MATVQIWKGVKRVVLGEEYAFVENEEFEGETIGACWEEENSRGTQTTFYQTRDGRIVVHVVQWSRWENEATYAYSHVFPALEGVNGAAAMFWRELEQAGLIPPRTVSLSE
jgi:hypothetical protein